MKKKSPPGDGWRHKPIHLAIKDLWPGGYPKYRWFRVCRPDDLCWVSDSMPAFLTEDPDKATCQRCHRIIAYKMAKELK